jgi:hypothetical protein
MDHTHFKLVEARCVCHEKGLAVGVGQVELKGGGVRLGIRYQARTSRRNPRPGLSLGSRIE